jgi:hypothetical protein
VKTGGFQLLSNGSNAAVHHIRGRQHIRASGGVGQGLFHQHFIGDVIQSALWVFHKLKK